MSARGPKVPAGRSPSHPEVVNAQATTVPPEASRTHRQWFGLRSGVRRLRMRLSASEPHARTVWLVLVRRVGVAWGEEAHVYAATTTWRNADSHYQGAVADSHEQGGTHVVQLVPWLTTADPRSLIGGTISGQVPAAREFRP